MIIDERILKDGITVPLLAKLIRKHEGHAARYAKLRDYYLGKHAIQSRRKSSAGVANNKIICNHAKYITDMMQAYLVGNAVTYAASEEYDIEPIKNVYLEQDIASLDSELVKHMSMYGRAYELVYADGAGNPASSYIPPEQAFTVYSDDCAHTALFGVYYYKIVDVDGNVTGVVCNVYTDAQSFAYEGASDNWNNMELAFEGEHFFGAVPLIEYTNNCEKQGDYEQVIPLIDAYNILMSDRVNDKEQFVDAFLFLTNIDVDTDQAKKLKQERILMGYDGARAEYLSKVLSENDVKVLRDNLKEDIHRFSMVPNLSDENFGNNLSGVAIKYKLLGFEQATKNKERYFAKALKARFKRYNHFLSLKGQMAEVPIHRVDVVFTRNLPVNNYEVAQMISNLSGVVTQETLLDQLDFVSDPKEEAFLAQKEQLQQHTRRMEAVQEMAEGGGY